MSVKPILFNTDMVRAILDGRKTVTRRLIKVPPYYPHFYKLHDNTDGAITGTKDRLYAGFYKDEQIFYIDGEMHIDAVYYLSPCKPGDILYVRETWSPVFVLPRRYLYKVECKEAENFPIKWHPSIHMPKEAARIWLKVTDVRVERLQDITPEQADREGVGKLFVEDIAYSGKDYGTQVDEEYGIAKEQFAWLWDSTIKKSELDRYDGKLTLLCGL